MKIVNWFICCLTNSRPFRYADPTEEQVVLDLYKVSPSYFLNVEGCEPNIEIVRRDFIWGPKKKSDTYHKEFLFIDYNGTPIGVADLHFDHPTPGTTYIGFLMIQDAMSGKGLGRRSYELIEHYAKTVFGTNCFLLGLNEGQDKTGFWQAMGFAPSGKVYTYTGTKKTSNVIEYVKTLDS